MSFKCGLKDKISASKLHLYRSKRCSAQTVLSPLVLQHSAQPVQWRSLVQQWSFSKQLKMLY